MSKSKLKELYEVSIVTEEFNTDPKNEIEYYAVDKRDTELVVKTIKSYYTEGGFYIKKIKHLGQVTV